MPLLFSFLFVKDMFVESLTVQAVTSSLKFVSGERDHWRAATEEARRTSERLAIENNR